MSHLNDLDPTYILSSLSEFVAQLYYDPATNEVWVNYDGFAPFTDDLTIVEWLTNPKVREHLITIVGEGVYNTMLAKRKLNSTTASIMLSYILLDPETVKNSTDPRPCVITQVLLAAGIQHLAEAKHQQSLIKDLPTLVLCRLGEDFIVELVNCTEVQTGLFTKSVLNYSEDLWTLYATPNKNQWKFDSNQMDFRKIVYKDFQAIAQTMGVRFKNLL